MTTQEFIKELKQTLDAMKVYDMEYNEELKECMPVESRDNPCWIDSSDLWNLRNLIWDFEEEINA